MPARTRHPRLAAIACRMYRLMIVLYPAEFRRSFDHELIVTFRNQAEDALNGGVLAWLGFTGHVTWDWVRTWGTLTIDSDTPAAVSLLGLQAHDDHAWGCLDRATVDVSFVFAVAGVVLMVVGWYRFVVLLLTFAHPH
jgi:hypothetical protein